MKRIISLIIAMFMLVGSIMVLSSCGDEDGGSCKYCGTHTNWTYRGGGYICYACDH